MIMASQTTTKRRTERNATIPSSQPSPPQQDQAYTLVPASRDLILNTEPEADEQTETNHYRDVLDSQGCSVLDYRQSSDRSGATTNVQNSQNLSRQNSFLSCQSHRSKHNTPHISPTASPQSTRKSSRILRTTISTLTASQSASNTLSGPSPIPFVPSTILNRASTTWIASSKNYDGAPTTLDLTPPNPHDDASQMYDSLPNHQADLPEHHDNVPTNDDILSTHSPESNEPRDTSDSSLDDLLNYEHMPRCITNSAIQNSVRVPLQNGQKRPHITEVCEFLASIRDEN